MIKTLLLSNCKNAALIISVLMQLLYCTVAAAKSDSAKVSPLHFETSYLADWYVNIAGGIKSGNRYLGMTNIKGLLNTEDAGLHKGGSIFINAANTHGRSPSAELTGDFQVASNIEAGYLTYLHELWYRQELGRSTFIVGLQDLNSEFAVNDVSSDLLNSSFGIHSSISSNMPVPIFPLTALGIQWHYNFNDRFTYKMAFFDGLPDDFSINPHNIRWRFKKDDGYLWFNELSYTIDKPLPGSVKAGFYYHNAHNIAYVHENIRISEGHPENHGFYLTADQQIMQKADKSMSIFVQAGITPANKNNNSFYTGCGVSYSGLFSVDDVMALGIAHASLVNRAETTIELTWKRSLCQHIFIQPDFQFIINPSGTNSELRDAYVFILRMGMNF